MPVAMLVISLFCLPSSCTILHMILDFSMQFSSGEKAFEAKVDHLITYYK
jgi:hypothetical protein